MKTLENPLNNSEMLQFLFIFICKYKLFLSLTRPFSTHVHLYVFSLSLIIEIHKPQNAFNHMHVTIVVPKKY